MLPIKSGAPAAAPPSTQRAAPRLMLRACRAKLCLMQGNWPDRADWKRRPLPRDSRRRWRAKSLPARLEYTQRVTGHSESLSEEVSSGKGSAFGCFDTEASRNSQNSTASPSSPATPRFMDPTGYTPARHNRVDALVGRPADDCFSPPAALSSADSSFSAAEQSPRTAEIAWEPAPSHAGIFYPEDAPDS